MLYHVVIVDDDKRFPGGFPEEKRYEKINEFLQKFNIEKFDNDSIILLIHGNIKDYYELENKKFYILFKKLLNKKAKFILFTGGYKPKGQLIFTNIMDKIGADIKFDYIIEERKNPSDLIKKFSYELPTSKMDRFSVYDLLGIISSKTIYQILFTLLPIDILCQGALLYNDYREGSDLTLNDFLKGCIQDTLNLKENLDYSDVLPFSKIANDLLGELNFNPSDNKCLILEKIMGQESSSNLSKLWNAALDESLESTGNKDVKEIVKEAHIEYITICEIISECLSDRKNNDLKNFEMNRVKINHNALKNDILSRMTNDVSLVSNRIDKKIRINILSELLLSIGEITENVKLASEYWMEGNPRWDITGGMKDVINRLIREAKHLCQYMPNEETFPDDKIIEKWFEAIGNVLGNLNKLPPKNTPKRRVLVDEFWNASISLHDFLHDISIHSAEFWKYFKKRT